MLKYLKKNIPVSCNTGAWIMTGLTFIAIAMFLFLTYLIVQNYGILVLNILAGTTIVVLSILLICLVTIMIHDIWYRHCVVRR